MSPEVIIGIVGIVVALLSLGVAYVADQRAKRTSEQANRLAYQTAKNNVRSEINKVQLDDQRQVQDIFTAWEEYKIEADRVAALGIPELSDQARDQKAELSQDIRNHVESNDLQPEIKDVHEALDTLPAEQATGDSPWMMEEVKEKVLALATQVEGNERNAADVVSSLRKLTAVHRETIRMFAQSDDLDESAEEDDSAE